MKMIFIFIGVSFICFIVSVLMVRQSRLGESADWWKADRSSVGVAPLPETEPRAIVQVYAARTFGWRGYFSVHTWVAIKRKDAKSYQTLQVIGFRLNRGLDALVIEDALPDTKWFGNKPELLRDLRGPLAEKAIPKIEQAAKDYAYPHAYRVWPGPNSNSFVSLLLRRTPEIGIELPPNAIGKDWIDQGALFGWSETHTGFQFSILGVCGLTIGLGDGIEVNLLGLSFGIDFLRPALKLPFIGRVGLQDAPVFADPISWPR